MNSPPLSHVSSHPGLCSPRVLSLVILLPDKLNIFPFVTLRNSPPLVDGNPSGITLPSWGGIETARRDFLGYDVNLFLLLLCFLPKENNEREESKKNHEAEEIFKKRTSESLDVKNSD